MWARILGWRATNQLRADLALHCLKLDLGFHHDHTVGEMIERLDGDIMDIAVFFAQFVVRVLGNLLLLVGVVVVLLWVDWRISLALGIYTLLSLISFYYMRRQRSPTGKPPVKLRRISLASWRSTFPALKIYALAALGPCSAQALPTEQSPPRQTDQGRGHGHPLCRYVVCALDIGPDRRLHRRLSALPTGGGNGRHGLFDCLLYRSRLQPLNEITNQFQNVQKAIAGINRVEALHAESSKIRDEGTAVLPAGPLAVHFADVTFGYVADEPVLRNISFDLPKGRVMGLLGRTGSGKTTMTRLLYRLYDPTNWPGHARSRGCGGHSHH